MPKININAKFHKMAQVVKLHGKSGVVSNYGAQLLQPINAQHDVNPIGKTWSVTMKE